MFSELTSLSHSQKERLAHIDFTLMFNGEAGRSYLTERFNVAPSVATQDFARYKELAPDNVKYDEKRRLHLKTETFKPLFEYDVIRTLSTISQGFGDGFLGKLKAPLACEAPYHLNKPSLNIVAAVSEAIHKRVPLKIVYVSLSSGRSERLIIPHTLVDNGLRWHVRAFDRKHDQFRDFVLTRIKEANLSGPSRPDGKVDEERERVQQDKQWNRIVDLELIPHPKIEHPEAVILDYGMLDGFLKVEVRAAVAGYLLRLWNVDCSNDHMLCNPEMQLALRNPEALYGVENAMLAPGVIST